MTWIWEGKSGCHIEKIDEPVFVLIFLIKNFILCEWDFCLHACVHQMCMAMEARRGCQIPWMELQNIVSCHVCAGNCTRVLFGSSQCSQLLSCLSGPTLTVYSFRTTVLLHCACCPLTPRSSLLLPLLGSFSSCQAPQPSLLTHSSSHFAHTHPVRFSFFSHLKNSHSIKAQAATEGSIVCCHCVSPTPTCLGTRALLQQRRWQRENFLVHSLGHEEELPHCLSLLS